MEQGVAGGDLSLRNGQGQQEAHATTLPASTAQKRRQEDGGDYGALAEGDVGPEAGGLSPPPKKAKLDWAGSKDSESDELDEGEIRDPLSDGERSEQLDTTAEDARALQQVGWNRGVTGGLRTSFMSSGKLGPRNPTEASAKLAHEPLATDAASEASDTNPLETEGGSLVADLGGAGHTINLQISRSISASIFKSNPYKDDRKTQAWFIDWLAAVLPLNKGNPAVFDSQLLTVAYKKWLVSQDLTIKKRNKAEISASHLMAKDGYKGLVDKIQNGASPDLLRQLIPDSAAATPDSDWELPPRVDISGLDIAVDDTAGWDTLFERWCKDFFSINQPRLNGKRLRAKHALSYYKRWLKGAPKAMQKAAIKRAEVIAKGHKIGSILALVRLEAASLSSRAASSTNAEHPSTNGPGKKVLTENGATINGQANTPAALASAPSSSLEDNDTASSLYGISGPEYLLKYFPGLADGDVFCIMCASQGHLLADCPSLICRFCQDDHPSYACPTRQRCSKCRQIGHSRENCQEKLKLALDERNCAICQSKEHAEANCDELWRSFEPDPSITRKVGLLPVFCYFCGSDGHYGAECGLNRSTAKVSRRETWCKASFDLYLDPNSPEVALALQAPPAGAFASTHAADERPDFGGRSIVPQSHIVFEADDDDDNEAFLHAPVQRKARPGNIRFSARQGSAQQLPPPPPLPPGPPPPRLRQQPPPSYRQRAKAPPPRPARGNRRRGKGGQ